MRRRRLAQVTAVGNALVLAAGLALVYPDLAASPDVVFGAEDRRSSSSPVPPDSEPLLPTAGEEDRPLPDPDARLVDLPAHDLEYLPPVPRVGVLAGDADLDGGCVWVEFDDEPQAIRWLRGFQAAFAANEDGAESFELVDASGRVVAREGDTIGFTGARSGGSERLERCHVGTDHVWYVDAVTTDLP